MIKEYETTVSKIIYYIDKNKKKTNFWRISVKFHLWVTFKYSNYFVKENNCFKELIFDLIQSQ